jgi:hypothetical protein
MISMAVTIGVAEVDLADLVAEVLAAAVPVEVGS